MHPRTPKPKPKPPATDRRSGIDRRQVDKAPPGGRDRRRRVESRQPEVVELEMSVADWLALTQTPPVPKKQ